MNKRFLIGAALTTYGALGCAAQTKSYTPGEPAALSYKEFAVPFLERNCTDCHDDWEAKGDLMLHNIGPVEESNAAVWKAVWAQVALQEMPPKEEKEQPGLVERLQFADWIIAELEQTMKDKGGFKAHLDPKKGNFLHHDLLFKDLPKGLRLVPPSSPARIWRITPQEHITRLNELINTEPPYDPAKPGLRTHGDLVPTNHGGELKLYFGIDRIIKHQGGTVAYATAVKAVPAVLSSNRKHGFENYADFYSVNGAESTQILGKAEDILRYMAYGPLSIASPAQITDDPDTYPMKTDIRGLPTSLIYSTQVLRPLTPVYELMKDSEAVTDERLLSSIHALFEALTFRPATHQEATEYLNLVKDSIAEVGKEDGIFMGLSSIFLNRDALFRPELASVGTPDEHGRVLLQDWELGLAVNHALRYLKPDEELRKAIVEGRMRTREDVAREVTRMLEDDRTRKPRVLRFFQDYFDHDLAGYICKDSEALAKVTSGKKDASHYRAMFDAKASTDRLIELILNEDQHVLKELLTTERVVATTSAQHYFGTKFPQQGTPVKRMTEEEDFKIVVLETEVADLTAKLEVTPKDKQAKRDLTQKKKALALANKKAVIPKNKSIVPANLKGPPIYARVSRPSFAKGSMKPERILATVPQGERLGILTHPSWLVSHSDAMDNHAIHRGIWIRERLLGGGIPDVPITVDAQLPDEPGSTLRERMRVTREKSCYVCHEKMDPLGLPFEMYNHAGLFRTTEQGQPVNTSGAIIDSGDPQLDGPVTNAIEMIQKLAESERVEQVFVRHAFRFWMGRNETIHDGPVIRAAHKSYRDSGGSMNALIKSLLTSDAFLYRKRER